MKVRLYLAMMVLVMLAAPVFAQEAAMTPKTSGEVANLEANFPTQLVDTQTVPQGKLELGVATGYQNFKGDMNGPDDIFVSIIPTVSYGILPNLQAMFSMPLLFGEGINRSNIGIVGNTDASANFDSDLGLLWRINEETEYLPSFGIGASVKAPTGYGATGWDGTALGVITKSIGPVRVNVNASITTIGKANGNIITENHLDSYSVGASFPVMDNLVLIADVYTSENPTTAESAQRINVAEVGARYALSETDILSGGIGAGFGPGSFTPAFVVTVGYQKLL